jgi:serine/threonine protein kinase
MHSIVGSYPYLAPEILKINGDRAEYSEKVDVWSAGLIFHEILSKDASILINASSIEEVKRK